jgi:hypothetical protein
MRNAYKVLVRKPEGERTVGKHWHKWEDNIKMDLKEIGYEAVDWIQLDQSWDQWRAVGNAIMKLRSPFKAGSFFSG